MQSLLRGEGREGEEGGGVGKGIRRDSASVASVFCACFRSSAFASAYTVSLAYEMALLLLLFLLSFLSLL